jgi:cytochrome c biogenesis factor
MLRFFLSIKTYLWVTGLSIAVFLTGSLMIPHDLAFFSEINDMPLFSWISRNFSSTGRIFWIYILILLMFILWATTLICSIDAIIKRTRRNALIRVLSPQILHIAILFVLLGHAVSASTGYKEDISIKIGNSHELRGFSIRLENLEFINIPGENSTRWRAHLLIDGRKFIAEPARPAFYRGTGFFIKSAQQRKQKAIIGLVNDPGTTWEVAGAIIFIIGVAGIFWTRLNESQASGSRQGETNG